jgi:ribulose-bisphosphate carboxylase large chain
MDAKDRQGFFADRTTLNLEDYVIFDYYFESTIDPKDAAAHLCQEQSTAQWKRVGVDEDLRHQFGAKVIELLVERELDTPSYPLLARSALHSYGCRVKIAYPHGNFGPKLPNILSAACGEGTFYSKGISVIKLFDIEFPDSFLENFEGPKFGIAGVFWGDKTESGPKSRTLCRAGLPGLVRGVGYCQGRRDAHRCRLVTFETESRSLGSGQIKN